MIHLQMLLFSRSLINQPLSLKQYKTNQIYSPEIKNLTYKGKVNKEILTFLCLLKRKSIFLFNKEKFKELRFAF